MSDILERYTPAQRQVIGAYWETVRFTRSTGKISDGIKQREYEYWSQYDPTLVIRALSIHIEKYPNIKENYTRGIIRNLSKGRASAPSTSRSGFSAKPKIEVVHSTTSTEVSDEEYAEMLEFAKKMQAKK